LTRDNPAVLRGFLDVELSPTKDPCLKHGKTTTAEFNLLSFSWQDHNIKMDLTDSEWERK
jgi:hypothetical protein